MAMRLKCASCRKQQGWQWLLLRSVEVRHSLCVTVLLDRAEQRRYMKGLLSSRSAARGQRALHEHSQAAGSGGC